MAEDRGTYTASTAPADVSHDAPDNVRRLPMRGFTQADNAYYDDLLGVISPTAYYCLSYIVRNTLGYHRESIRLSYKQLGDTLNLSRNTVMRGLQELEAAHIIASDAGERGRTQVRAYHLLPITAWTLPARCTVSTSAKTALVEDEGASAKNALVETQTSAENALVVSKNALVETQTSAKIEHLINKERNKVSKQIESDAHASPAPAEPVAAPPSKKSTATRSRRYTGEEQAYVAQGIKALCAEMHLKKHPAEGQERDGLHWFSTARDGQPVSVDEVMAWYRLIKREPYWQGKFLSLKSVAKTFVAHSGDLEAFRRDVEHTTQQQRRGDVSNGTSAAARRQPYQPAQPDAHDDGEYARYVKRPGKQQQPSPISQ
ncbi:MAG: replication protein [Ktedonobacterales bacterium]|nr:replication protein [Ktedonobacterales bacterium]